MKTRNNKKVDRLSETVSLLVDAHGKLVTIFNEKATKLAIQIINDSDEYLFNLHESCSKEISINLKEWTSGWCFLNISSKGESYSKKIELN